MANKHVKDLAGTREVVTDYQTSDIDPQSTVVPSSRDSRLIDGNAGAQSGLQMNGFDPHAPGIQVIDMDTRFEQTWNPATDPHPMAKNKTVPTSTTSQPEQQQTHIRAQPENPQPAIKKQSNGALLYLHTGRNLKIPLHVNSVVIDPEKQMLVIVTEVVDDSQAVEFEVSEEGEYLMFSSPNYSNIMYCTYLGQSFKLGPLNIDVFILEHQAPKE